MVRGTIRHRLLVNAVVDPDEAARRLPAGLRPHVTDDGTVIGCCLLAIERIRPAGVPGVLGTRLRAAAHRISAEWDDGEGTPTVGVYVPVRHTDSITAMGLGGRWFPGVHRPARIRVTEDDRRLGWSVTPRSGTDRFGIRVEAAVASSETAPTCDQIGATCLAAAVGVSPDHRGVLEGARMTPGHRDAQPVEIAHLDSQYLAGFASIRSAPSYLMRDVPVTWTTAGAPHVASDRLSA